MDATLAKGLSVLDWLVRQQRGCRVVDVAEAFGLARSNAHRTLKTLVACGWAQQDAATATYRASLRVFELGSLVEASIDLRRLLQPHLAQLASALGETIHLAVLDGPDIVYLDKFDSPLPVAAYSRIGGRAPAHCVASGKALLAAQNASIDDLITRLGPLASHTPHTITNVQALHAELQSARQRGLAENREEWRLGVCGLGSPVFNARGEPVAAIGISVPSIRFARSQVRKLADHLLSTAGDASRSLGYGSSSLQTQADALPTETAHPTRRQR